VVDCITDRDHAQADSLVVVEKRLKIKPELEMQRLRKLGGRDEPGRASRSAPPVHGAAPVLGHSDPQSMSTPVARRAEYQARHRGNQSGSQTAMGAEGNTVLEHKGPEEAVV
jgi:hypothetical protein